VLQAGDCTGKPRDVRADQRSTQRVRKADVDSSPFGRDWVRAYQRNKKTFPPSFFQSAPIKAGEGLFLGFVARPTPQPSPKRRGGLPKILGTLNWLDKEDTSLSLVLP